MSRYTDIDLFLQNIEEIYCKNCERRKGMKNGKQKFVYAIGEAPCRCCAVDEMKYEVENAPTADVVDVVRCKDCKHCDMTEIFDAKTAKRRQQLFCMLFRYGTDIPGDWFCADGERKENEND